MSDMKALRKSINVVDGDFFLQPPPGLNVYNCCFFCITSSQNTAFLMKNVVFVKIVLKLKQHFFFLLTCTSTITRFNLNIHHFPRNFGYI